MKVPKGYCDLRVDRVNDDIIQTFVNHGYSIVAANTTVNCSTLNVGTSNRKKRKFAELNNEKDEDKDCVPTPKWTNENNLGLTILNRLTIQIMNIGQLQTVMNSPNFKLYDILAVEPLNEQVIKDVVTSSSIDILCCNTQLSIAAKDYLAAVRKSIYFELSYAPMLINRTVRQQTITLAHLFHIKGKSKNVIVSSKAANKLDVRNPNDVINLGFLLGLSEKQSKESITKGCYSIILKSYGRKLGKSAIRMVQEENGL